MNLITNGEEEQQGQENKSAQNEQDIQTAQEGQSTQNVQNVQTAGQNTQTAQAPVPGVAPEPEIKKVVVVDEDQESERLSEEIRGQLEQQLEAELEEQAGAAAGQTEPPADQEPGQPSQEIETMEQKPTETVNETAETEDTAPVNTTETETEIVEPTMDTEMNTASETENMETAANTAAATESSNTTTQPTMPSQPGYRMVNVMETLVARVDLDKYMEEYGVCPCPRCRADVHALILTTLPSKYVVMDESAISPMLNFYESRRKTDIFTATLKACLDVKENPRHKGDAEE